MRCIFPAIAAWTSIRFLQYFQRGFFQAFAGKSLVRKKRYEEAEAHYRRAVDTYPDNVALRKNLAVVKALVGDYDGAAANFGKILDDYPENRQVAAHMVKALMELGSRENTVEELKNAISRYKRSSRFMLSLGVLYERMGRDRDALELFRSAFEKEPSIEAGRHFYSHCGKNGGSGMGAFIESSGPKRIKDLFLQRLPLGNEDVQKMLYGELEQYSGSYFSSVSHDLGWTYARRAVAVADYASERMNIVNNRRRTTGQPGRFDKTIHVLGASQAFGAWCEDDHTIASQLQRICNSSAVPSVRVVNWGIPGYNIEQNFLQIFNIGIARGDIVVLLPRILGNRAEIIEYLKGIEQTCLDKGASFFLALVPLVLLIKNPSKRELDLQRIIAGKFRAGRSKLLEWRKRAKLIRAVSELGVKRIDMEHIFDRPHSLGEIFTDSLHFNHKANRAMAEAIHRHLSSHAGGGARRSVPRPPNPELKRKAVRELQKAALDNFSKNADIASWLKESKNPGFDACNTVGAIVMNCNPFTRGHRHLVRQAAAMVDGLYVFVVQEDKSFFPFADRIEMARRGVVDLDGNIHVAPSGKFVISSFSFAEYFSKEQALTPPDPTVDIVLFGSIIARNLRITHRFVGDEPYCITTNEYNETMMFLLPDMGVEMHVIPRLEEGGQAISASSVRQAMRDNDLDALRKLVPPTTIDVLEQGGHISLKA